MNNIIILWKWFKGKLLAGSQKIDRTLQIYRNVEFIIPKYTRTEKKGMENEIIVRITNGKLLSDRDVETQGSNQSTV